MEKREAREWPWQQQLPTGLAVSTSQATRKGAYMDMPKRKDRPKGDGVSTWTNGPLRIPLPFEQAVAGLIAVKATSPKKKPGKKSKKAGS